MSEVITDTLELWTSALLAKSTAGRGRNGKQGAYGIQKLRELILELAVRGKLVPQDPDDEPAKYLLKRIAAEKARLLAEGKIGNSRSLPEIDVAEIPFEIPEQWEWVRLGNLGEIFNGNSISKRVKEAKYTNIEGGLPFIATKDVGYGWQQLDYENGVSIPEEELSFKVAHKGAVLICAEGGSAGKKCGITDKDICFGNKLYALEPYVDMAPDFLLANYLSPTFFAQFSAKMTGIIGGISLAKFKQLLLPLPPVNEQRRIVAKVGELMALCDQLEQQQTYSIETHQTLVETLLGTLVSIASPQELTEAWSRISDHFDTLFTTEQSIDQLKQTILQLAVMGKLVPQDPNDEPASVLLKKIEDEKERLIKEGKLSKRKVQFKEIDTEVTYVVPDSWKECRVGDLALQVTDGTHKTPTYVDEGVRFVSAKDIGGGELSFNDCKYISENEHKELVKRCNPEYGDILVSKSGSIGTVVLVDDHDEFSLFESLALIKFSHPFLDKEYFQLALQNACNVMTDTHIRGVAVKHLHLNVLRGMKIPLPPKNEQTRIVDRVKELITLCDELKARLTDAQTTQVHLADAIVEQAVA